MSGRGVHEPELRSEGDALNYCRPGVGRIQFFSAAPSSTAGPLKFPLTEQRKRATIALYSRYCVRCHGVDGRGVWDIPDVPDFTNGTWQASRSDAQLARIVWEGRGAVMPRFRGTLTYEQTWDLARYLRTF